ncbi:MAG: 50S ribosomal protein L25 [Actinomycetota bacterium]|nr:50S ribosomal protein L25 [Actinomycetota bacterium]
MTESTTIIARRRDIIGKANRRMTDEIPAILYGTGREALPVAVDRHDFELFISHHGAGSTLVSISVEGEATPVNAMVKEVQTSPVKGTILHIDFLAVRMDQIIQASVGLHFIGESPGVKAGGVLMQSVHTVTVEALPAELPEAIEIDVSALELGDSLHMSDLVGPEGVTIVDDPEVLVCSVTTPTAEPVEEELVAEEGAEPEVIGEESDDGKSEES